MHFVEIGAKVAHAAVVPAEINIIADHVGDLIEFAGGLEGVEICRRGGAVGIQRLHHRIQPPAVFVHKGRIPEHGNLVLNPPAENRRMVDVLEDQLAQLLLGVLHQSLALGHLEHRHLGPGQKPQLVAAVIGRLGVLIMGQAYAVCADLGDQGKVLADHLAALGTVYPGTVLMLCHAPDPAGQAVEQQAASGAELDTAKARAQLYIVGSAAVNQQLGPYRVQMRAAPAVPEPRLCHRQADRLVRCSLAAADGLFFLIADGIADPRPGCADGMRLEEENPVTLFIQ